MLKEEVEQIGAQVWEPPPPRFPPQLFRWNERKSETERVDRQLLIGELNEPTRGLLIAPRYPIKVGTVSQFAANIRLRCLCLLTSLCLCNANVHPR